MNDGGQSLPESVVTAMTRVPLPRPGSNVSTCSRPCADRGAQSAALCLKATLSTSCGQRPAHEVRQVMVVPRSSSPVPVPTSAV